MRGCGCGGYQEVPDPKPYMHIMNIPKQYTPMAVMPKEQLEIMYPRIYYIVYPAVQGYCDMMGIRPGVMYSPTKQELDRMVEGICRSVEGQVAMDENTGPDSRQPFYGYGGRGFLRDLVGILLIRELLRRRPFYGYPR